MLIKGRNKSGPTKKEELFTARSESSGNTENDPSHSLIKRGKLSFEPVPLFLAETLERTGTSFSARPEGLGISGEDASMASEEDLERLQEKAENYLAQARTEADSILSEAQNKARKLIEQSKLYSQTAKSNAEREGFAEGKEKARDTAREELRNVIETARETLEETRRLHDDLARRMESGLAKLAIKIAEKVIAREVSLNPDVVISMVRSQLEKMKDRDHVIIHVNPDDYPSVKDKKELFIQFAPQVRSLEIQADPRVDRGGCMVETNLGTVDACISTQLEAIELAFSKAEQPPIIEEGEPGAGAD